jgi:hypothetical protein
MRHAQIGYYISTGAYDFGLVEDQDIAMYGGNCLLFKLGKGHNQPNEGDWLDTSSWGEGEPLGRCGGDECGDQCKRCGLAVGLTRREVLMACVLSKTDYWPGLMNVGLAKGRKKVREHGNLGVYHGFGLSASEREREIQAMHTFLYHSVRSPHGETSVVRNRLIPPPGIEEQRDFSAFLGHKPPNEIAHDIARFVRSPLPPYDLILSSPLASPPILSPPPPISDDNDRTDEALRAVPIPTPQTVSAFGLSAPVPRDRELTRDEIREISSLRVPDVAGADGFARNSEGKLLTPAQQLDEFMSRSKILTSDLKQYCRTRGLDLQLNKEPTRCAVEISMKKEVQRGKFFLVDPEDGRLETRRLVGLIQAGVLTTVNAPGYVPIPCPPMKDPLWRFAERDHLIEHGITAFTEMYRWVNLFYGDGSGMIAKAMKKFSSGRVSVQLSDHLGPVSLSPLCRSLCIPV